MNSSPVETMEGAGAFFTFAHQPGTVQGIFWVMCGVMAFVIVSSIIHEIRVGAKVARRRDRR